MADLVQIRVRFYTEFVEYAVTDQAIAIPTKLGVRGLSKIINHLLSLEPPMSFDFMIEKVLLRSTIGKYMSANEVSGESVIDIEYFPAFSAPDLTNEITEPDWISCVSSQRSSGFWATGSFDGGMRVYSANSATPTLLHTAVVHERPIKAMDAMDLENGDFLVVSGSKDQKVIASRFAGWGKGGEATPSPSRLVGGHAGSVEAVSVSADGNLVASGDWTGSVKIWSASGGPLAGMEGEEEEAPTKRARLDLAGTPSSPDWSSIASLDTGSKGVSALSWMCPITVASGGQDLSIRVLNVELAKETEILRGHHVVNSLHYSKESRLIASAHPDHVVRLWDSRSKGETFLMARLRGMDSWLSTVRWQPSAGGMPLLLATGYGGQSFVLDTRSPKQPLCALKKHVGKVFGGDWAAGESVRLLTGGEDKKVKIHSA